MAKHRRAKHPADCPTCGQDMRLSPDARDEIHEARSAERHYIARLIRSGGFDSAEDMANWVLALPPDPVDAILQAARVAEELAQVATRAAAEAAFLKYEVPIPGKK